jgi:hypothetical protein
MKWLGLCSSRALSDVIIVSKRTHFLLHDQGLAVLENGLRDLVACVELVHEALA